MVKEATMELKWYTRKYLFNTREVINRGIGKKKKTGIRHRKQIIEV